MEMDKIVNLDHEELALQAHQSAEQIFRLRFQMKMGQLEGLKKLRELKKDIARIKTVERQRELGIATHAHVNANAAEAAPKRKIKKAAKKSAAAKGPKSKKARQEDLERGIRSGRRRSPAKRSRQARPR